jgi:hypothetical protein
MHALTLAQTLLRARGVFSTNESLEDVSSQGLPFMLVDFVAGEVVGRLRTDDRAERLKRLQEADVRRFDPYETGPACLELAREEREHSAG